MTLRLLTCSKPHLSTVFFTRLVEYMRCSPICQSGTVCQCLHPNYSFIKQTSKAVAVITYLVYEHKEYFSITMYLLNCFFFFKSHVTFIHKERLLSVLLTEGVKLLLT